MDKTNEKAYRISIIRQVLRKTLSDALGADVRRLKANCIAHWGLSPRTVDEYITIAVAQEQLLNIANEVIVVK